MESNTYNLIINSANINKENIAAAREQLCTLFQLQQNQLDKLFSNKPLRIIKDINYTRAQHYRDAIVKAGVECKIETSSQEQENPSASPPSATTFSLLNLEKQQTTQITQTYLCPVCQTQQTKMNANTATIISKFIVKP